MTQAAWPVRPSGSTSVSTAVQLMPAAVSEGVKFTSSLKLEAASSCTPREASGHTKDDVGKGKGCIERRIQQEAVRGVKKV